MHHNNRELWAAFIAVILVTFIYLYVMSQLGGVPAASGLFGHGIGIVGFIFMLMTETLYTWRKRSVRARWGRMAAWLRFHIFTGLVGPYMVLLHSSWKFNGLAGIVMLLTVVIVLSGIVGRYIFTAIPRSSDGVAVEASKLEAQLAAIEASLDKWKQSQSALLRSLVNELQADFIPSGSTVWVVFGRTISDLGFQFRFFLTKQKIESRYRAQANELLRLLKRRRVLGRQVASLIMARRLLSIWHAVHVPIGVALFTTAFVHILGAIYYATLLK